MLEWIMQNAGTMTIILVLLAIVAVDIRALTKERKNGKTSCGCDCKNCSMCGACHKTEKE